MSARVASPSGTGMLALTDTTTPRVPCSVMPSRVMNPLVCWSNWCTVIAEPSMPSP